MMKILLVCLSCEIHIYNFVNNFALRFLFKFHFSGHCRTGYSSQNIEQPKCVLIYDQSFKMMHTQRDIHNHTQYYAALKWYLWLHRTAWVMLDTEGLELHHATLWHFTSGKNHRSREYDTDSRNSSSGGKKGENYSMGTAGHVGFQSKQHYF